MPKTKRVTVMQEIIQRYKKTPGPMTYKTQPKRKPVNKNTSKTVKSGYMGEVEFLAKSAPGVGKYDLNKSFSYTDKHSRQYKFPKPKEERPKSSIRPPKLRNPGPSDYEVEKSMERTQLKKSYTNKMNKTKKKTFLDDTITKAKV